MTWAPFREHARNTPGSDRAHQAGVLSRMRSSREEEGAPFDISAAIQTIEEGAKEVLLHSSHLVAIAEPDVPIPAALSLEEQVIPNEEADLDR
jgi:hypothetical protein